MRRCELLRMPAGRRLSRPAGKANNPCTGSGMRLFRGRRHRTVGSAQKPSGLLIVGFAPRLVRRMAVLDGLCILVELAAGLVRRLAGLDRLAVVRAARRWRSIALCRFVVDLAAGLVGGAAGFDCVVPIRSESCDRERTRSQREKRCCYQDRGESLHVQFLQMQALLRQYEPLTQWRVALSKD